MKGSLNSLYKRKKDINNILTDINDGVQTKEDIKDIYELDDELYDYLESKDELWLEKFYDFLKITIENEMEFDDEKNVIYMLLKSKNSNKKFIKYFIDGLNLFNLKKDVDVSSQSSSISEKINNEQEDAEFEIDITNKMLKNFKWRDGQLEAIDKIKENNFKSGVVSMITGSGKSLIFLKTINEHSKLKETEKGVLYILLCPRIDIIRSLFFRYSKSLQKYQFNKNRLDFWTKSDIINIDNFNIIDRINIKDKKIVLDKHKYNLLLINNDFMRSIYKDDKIKKTIQENTKLVIVDECHCISGNKIYDILNELKYSSHIPIIGFSATPIRCTAQSEINTINIFSKTYNQNNNNKRLNLIYSYDLIRGIIDGVVLPYRIGCVKINKIKHKIGITNKKVLNEIFLEKCIENKKNKLPYAKIIIWTNRKDIMKQCYNFIHKSFSNMKVYCTSSFDKELSEEGYNTNYEEFYHSKGNSVLVCINKCKEGSDIPNVDCGVYFDGVKNRSILVHIQTSGRVIRPDDAGKKTHGDLIDTFILDENETAQTLTAQKILSYLIRLMNLSDETYEGEIELYQKMNKLVRDMDYNYKTKTLKIKVDDKDEHNTIVQLNDDLEIFETDFNKFKDSVFTQVDKKFKVTKDKKLELEYKQIKEVISELNIETKYEYKKLCVEHDLPLEPNKKYSNIWKNWYDFLSVDVSLYPKTKEEFKELCEDYKIINEDAYYELCEENDELPKMPVDLYGNISDIFKSKCVGKRR